MMVKQFLDLKKIHLLTIIASASLFTIDSLEYMCATITLCYITIHKIQLTMNNTAPNG